MIRFRTIEIDRQPEQSRREAERDAVCKCLRLLGYSSGYKHHDNGAPYIESPTPIRVSISHSRRWAGVAVGEIDDPALGIDIESVDREGLQRVLPRVLTEAELAMVRESENGATKAWTAKEAVYKAVGRMGVDFRRDIRLDNLEMGLATFLPEQRRFKLNYMNLKENDLLCIASEYNNS